MPTPTRPRQPTKPKPPQPAKPTARARSASKTRGKGQPYDDATRAKVVAQLERDGMAATHAATGVPKSTLNRWAKSAGVDLGEGARARTAKATEAVRERAATVRLSTVEALEQHIAQAAAYLGTIAGVNAQAAQLIAEGDPDDVDVAVGLAGPYAVLKAGTEAAELGKIALALNGLPLAPRDAEGILTRAIHDLQLLKGEATERGEMVVEFTIPRPTNAVERDGTPIEATP